SGDREALERLLESVQEPLHRYILGLVRDHHLAEDILQETLMRIYRKLGYLLEPGLFRSWAFRIATNEAFRHLKRRKSWTDRAEDEAVLDTLPAPPPRDEFSTEIVERLPQLVAGISPASRAVIVLYYKQEMSLAEIASVLSVPLGTVKSRLAYGLARLR